MMQEYYEWLKKHPDATEEEKHKAWEQCIRMLEARNIMINMFLAYR